MKIRPVPGCTARANGLRSPTAQIARLAPAVVPVEDAPEGFRNVLPQEGYVSGWVSRREVESARARAWIASGSPGRISHTAAVTTRSGGSPPRRYPGRASSRVTTRSLALRPSMTSTNSPSRMPSRSGRRSNVSPLTCT